MTKADGVDVPRRAGEERHQRTAAWLGKPPAGLSRQAAGCELFDEQVLGERLGGEGARRFDRLVDRALDGVGPAARRKGERQDLPELALIDPEPGFGIEQIRGRVHAGPFLSGGRTGERRTLMYT